jgi:hypothetical protein
LHFKRIVEAAGGFGITTGAFKTIYFSKTVPPDVLATQLQNYGALAPDAAQYSASAVLSFLSSSAGHAALYGLAMTGAGIVVLQATHEKPTIRQAAWWAAGCFVLGVTIYVILSYFKIAN